MLIEYICSYSEINASKRALTPSPYRFDAKYGSLPVATRPNYDFAGWFTEENYPKDESYWDYSIGPMVGWQMTHGDYYPNTESIRRFYLQYFDEPVVVADPATFSMIIQSPEFAEMGTFPAVDSVKVINGVMTVKMMNDPWPPY